MKVAIITWSPSAAAAVSIRRWTTSVQLPVAISCDGCSSWPGFISSPRDGVSSWQPACSSSLRDETLSFNMAETSGVLPHSPAHQQGPSGLAPATSSWRTHSEWSESMANSSAVIPSTAEDAVSHILRHRLIKSHAFTHAFVDFQHCVAFCINNNQSVNCQSIVYSKYSSKSAGLKYHA